MELKSEDQMRSWKIPRILNITLPVGVGICQEARICLPIS
jgi:hypothetical protein